MLAITDWQLRQQSLSLLCLAGSVRSSFVDFMTACLPDIWEFHGPSIVYRIEYIGRGCVRTFVLTWHPVLFGWHANHHAHKGRGTPMGLSCD